MRRRFPLILVPLLAVIALFAWAVSSPVGSSPDDDFHLVSIWCASPASADYCQPTENAKERVVPESLVKASCFAFHPKASAACQHGLSFGATPTAVTDRGNTAGGYPPIYYATMGLLASSNIVVSAIAMRMLNVLLFVGLGTALYLLLPPPRRQALIWSWVVTTVPLGLFVLASNNPSAWAITGVGMGWLALLGYFETVGWRRITLGALFVLSAVMAAGSRGDSALYMVLAVVVVGILSFARTKRWFLSAILPVVVAVFCASLFRISRPIASLTQALPGGSSAGESVTGGVVSGGVVSGGGLVGAVQTHGVIERFLYNLLDVPSLWSGVFGDRWGLGWLDTSMPAVVWFGGLACFIAVGFVAVGRLNVRKLVVLFGGVVVLWLLPSIVLVSAGDSVGENVQPRYLLPLVILFAGVMLTSRRAGPVQFTRVQALIIALTLSVTQLLALNLNLRRYVTGFGNLGINLDSGIKWWWDWGISPMGVWILGSVAFASVLFILLPRHRGVLETVPERDSDAALVVAEA